jgi:hypothetical protein
MAATPERTHNTSSPPLIVLGIEAALEEALYATSKSIEDRVAPDAEPATEEEAADTNASVFAAYQLNSDLTRIIDNDLRTPMERALRLAKRALR